MKSPNSLVKLGLAVIVASLAAIAGNYTMITLPTGYISTSTRLKTGEYHRECTFYKSYRYEVLVSSGGGEVQFMMVSLWDYLASGGNIENIRGALINVTVRGSERINFKPSRRGVYITIIRNLSDRELSIGYAVTFKREPELDLIQDTLTMAFVGAILTIIGLTLKRLKERMKGCSLS